MNHVGNAAKFVSNRDRSKWHDQALWFIRQKRDNVVRTIPEWERLRELAAQIKGHTLSNLAELLEQFESNATAHGAEVHWASTPDELNHAVLNILRGNQATRLVKSKSMLTEECGLNDFLQEQGIVVVDSDLGERIIQLREEGPSHIVLPAIHLKKEEVGQLFHQYLGTEEGASDPVYLTEAARHHLRSRFLDADAGMTGVNFAIAETGGLVVCTNEGNADLGTSLPDLHIACMGIEKIIPRTQDLGVFLRLLARSATGQPITTYSSHYHGPKPGGKLHIVILDNGRSSIMGHEKFRRSLSCIRCGACLNTCPVFRRSGGHSYETTVPGPIGSILAPSRDAQKYQALPFACTMCGSCTDICPVKIDLHHQLLAMRKDLGDKKILPWSKTVPMGFASFVMRRPWLYRLTGKLTRVLLKYSPRFLIYNRFNRWGIDRELPEPPSQSFRKLYQLESPERK